MENIEELAETAKAINGGTGKVTEKDVAQYRRNLLQAVLNALNAVMLDNSTAPRLASKLARFRNVICSEIKAAAADFDNAAPTVFDNAAPTVFGNDGAKDANGNAVADVYSV